MPGVLYSVPLTALLTHTSTWDSWTLTGKPGSVSCGITAPLSWVLVWTRFVCALQEAVSPVLWEFCNQMPLAFKVKFPGDSLSLCQPQVGKSIVVLKLLQQCENFFGTVVLQSVGCLLRGSMVGLTCWASLVCCSQSPCPHSSPLLTHDSTGDTQTLKGRSGSVFWGVLACTRIKLRKEKNNRMGNLFKNSRSNLLKI